MKLRLAANFGMARPSRLGSATHLLRGGKTQGPAA
jgi:hypothetical protein